jgi:small subunit ribosomal protein S17
MKHLKYGKFLRRWSKLHAHDEKNEAQIGDRVVVMTCRPISKTKGWRLVKVLERQ